MKESQTQFAQPSLDYLQLNPEKIYYQTTPEELIKMAVIQQEGILTDNGALSIDTGIFTGRSPKDRYIVIDNITRDRVNWGEVNQPYSTSKFDLLYTKVCRYLDKKTVYVRDSFLCAENASQLDLRVITETATQNLFAHHMFLRPYVVSPAKQQDWTLVSAPGFKADPIVDETRQGNFTIINFSRRLVLIGGTFYNGEIKKAMFSVLNFLLPFKGVLPMHCSANVGNDGETSVFFGLSGTGKTTLSADPDRRLVGDDEHGWGNNGLFNFEGGCYAKTYGLSSEKEPQIFSAIRDLAMLENVPFEKGTQHPDYQNKIKTENGRAAYPLNYIPEAVTPAVAKPPKNVFFLSADAFGVLPPISKLTQEQAMYYFLSGYTCKLAGTESGINEPVPTFSACFGNAFLPLSQVIYADLLGKKLKQGNVNIWLINTGWMGGSCGEGKRIPLAFTRSMIKAAMNGDLNKCSYRKHAVLHLQMPERCPDVPTEMLSPVNQWSDKEAYLYAAYKLSDLFRDNFRQYVDLASSEVKAAQPGVSEVNL
ncbi:phosphoenolpyruvate carboxykinase (ATP) [Pedobacter sp. UYP30]|uniref:phosphoenolpyruvate carboxykinase (ATP) n=1 Tax=Pedobacter sp. UYP30 TaxID=1756400 RepID=UPI0033955FAF